MYLFIVCRYVRTYVHLCLYGELLSIKGVTYVLHITYVHTYIWCVYVALSTVLAICILAICMYICNV